MDMCLSGKEYYMRKTLNTSTALIAGLSLLAGGPVYPQETAPADPTMVCADGNAQPCAEGVELIPAPESAPAEEAAPVEEPVAEPAPEPAPEPEAVAPEPEPQPEAAPAEEAPAEAAPEAAAPEEAPATEQPAAEAPAEPSTTEEQPAEVAPETAAEPAAPVEDAVPEAPAATEEAPAPDQPVVSEPAAEAPADTEAAPAAEAAPEEAPAEAAPAAEATGRATPEAAPAVEAEAIPEEAIPVLPVQPDAATGEAPVAAAATADPEAAAPADAEVVEEVVTEDTARSSSEDFANPVNQPAAAATATAAAKARKKDKGLSDGEKAILLGLGALAVGAMISNNRKVELNSGDRVVVERPDGTYQIIKDDNALLRQPGSTVRTERFDDGSTRTTVTREDGSRIVTIRDAEYRVLRRVHVAPDGRQTLLVDDTVQYQPVDVTRLPPPAPIIEVDPYADEMTLREALSRQSAFDREFSLAQVRDIQQVRALVPVIDLNAITFETGSAAIRPDQAEALAQLGRLMSSYIEANPREMFLIEGHTDAVGSAASNLALSDRRAESVALAMSEYFGVPPENMVVQGYGEEFLKVQTGASERANRRASVRRITDLLRQASN
jgi:outer membrane protein OmpA-like peptidoglycan-associated protein